ncbi:MAG: YodL domain-containing protein [Hydrogenoanaerobacterium sp.]
MEAIKLKNSIIYYYKSPSGYLQNGQATLDPMFECDELKEWCSKNRYEAIFTDGIFDRLVRKESISQFMENEISLKNVRIWQLKADSDFSMRFIALDEFEHQFGQPKADSYEVIYDGNLGTNSLDEIYEICNMNHPNGYQGHSLSMSDVVELYDEDGSSFHYVDRFGFKEIDFKPSELTQGFDMKMQL